MDNISSFLLIPHHLHLQRRPFRCSSTRRIHSIAHTMCHHLWFPFERVSLDWWSSFDRPSILCLVELHWSTSVSSIIAMLERPTLIMFNHSFSAPSIVRIPLSFPWKIDPTFSSPLVEGSPTGLARCQLVSMFFCHFPPVSGTIPVTNETSLSSFILVFNWTWRSKVDPRPSSPMFWSQRWSHRTITWNKSDLHIFSSSFDQMTICSCLEERHDHLFEAKWIETDPTRRGEHIRRRTSNLRCEDESRPTFSATFSRTTEYAWLYSTTPSSDHLCHRMGCDHWCQRTSRLSLHLPTHFGTIWPETSDRSMATQFSLASALVIHHLTDHRTFFSFSSNTSRWNETEILPFFSFAHHLGLWSATKKQYFAQWCVSRGAFVQEDKRQSEEFISVDNNHYGMMFVLEQRKQRMC